MNWDAIGAVGEVLGAVAVIATLLYLAAQTRQTRVAVESASNIGTVEAHSRYRLALMQNPELANLLAKANSEAELSEGERIQIRMLFFEMFVDCAIGMLTQTGKNTPRTESDFLKGFLRENPSGIAEWKYRQQEMMKIVPEFCREIDEFIRVEIDT